MAQPRELDARRPAAALLALALAAAPAAAGEPDAPPRPLALRAAKALTCAAEGPQVIDDARLLLRDGRIEAIGPARDLAVPEGYEQLDLGRRWVMPGMIDLHTHVAGSGADINDMVFQTNEGLRVSATVVPRNPRLVHQLEAGVTTVLYIPGSGTNIGGQGVLLKTGPERYEDMLVRDPGSLKIAQGDNPVRWGYGMTRALMSHHIRAVVREGLAYARAWKDHEEQGGPTPERNLRLDVFRDLLERTTQVSTHTQSYQLVMQSMVLLQDELGIDMYIDHGEWGAFRLAPLAKELGVSAICGPRIIDTFASRADTDGAILSVPGEYQARGLDMVGFNTDAPVVPGEELPLQAAMGVRYGMRNDALQAVRGLTIVPALTAGIADRVGSLETGKDADLVVLDGDPADPRSAIQQVWIGGRCLFEAPAPGRGGRRW